MFDPTKLTFTCPGFDVSKGVQPGFGIPAAIVTNYLINKGIVCEKTDYYFWLLLNSLSTTFQSKKEPQLKLIGLL